MQETKETEVQGLGWMRALEEGVAFTPVFLPGESHGQRSFEPRSIKLQNQT